MASSFAAEVIRLNWPARHSHDSIKPLIRSAIKSERLRRVRKFNY